MVTKEEKETKKILREALKHEILYLGSFPPKPKSELTREEMKYCLDEVLRKRWIYHTYDKEQFKKLFKETFRKEMVFALGQS